MKNLSYQLVKKSKFNALKERVKSLELQIYAAKNFIKEIDKGNLSIDFQLAVDEESDSLASSLLNMRDQMKSIAEEEKQRNWTTEGLAKFIDILRSKNDDLKGLSETIISNIVKYMDANQGSLYILNDDDPSDIHLDLTASYAFNKKKFITQRIGIGDGLTGQVVLEKSPLFMTNLPPDYLKITSGLGEALPRNLLIVPLMLNGNVYGVIELASFNVFEKHHQEFIERLAESIASTISSVRINERTRKLLDESQVQTEQMRSQEEEMRQNMEELSATQEEMQRVLNEVEGKEAYVSQLLNISPDSIYTVDKEYKLVSWNKTFASSLERFGMRVEKGLSTIDWYQGEERSKQIKVLQRALEGESFETSTSNELNGKWHHYQTIFAPLKNDKGEIIEAAIFGKDVTAMTIAQNEEKQLRLDAQNKTEELKAQEEELRQNMEELSATQEEVQRILNEVQAKESYLNEVINSSKDSIFTIDQDYNLISFNDGFSAGLTSMGVNVTKGFPVLDIFPDEKTKSAQWSFYTRAFNGESFEVTNEFNYNDQVTHYTSSFSPLRDSNGKVFACAIFGKDVTEMVTARIKAETLAREAIEKSEEIGAQEEELRQNMEELSATQEEMHRILKETERKEAYINQLLNVSHDMIFTIDKQYRLVSWNKTFADSISKFGSSMEKGMDTLQWYPEGEARKKQKLVYDRILAGETFSLTTPSEINGVIHNSHSTHAPMRNEKGEVYEAAIFTRYNSEESATQKKQ